MTILIADNSPRISYTATSGQTAFTVPFEFFDNTDLNVYINDTLQTLTTHYTVTGGSGSTGSITLITGATAGDIVVITRDVTLERTTDFPTSGPFQVASLNTELDKVVAMIADMKDLADRGLRLSDSDTSAALVLANKDTRKGTVLAFNETTGAVEIGPTIADTNTVAQIKADIATVAGISANVTTVAGISSNVTTVANNDANVTTVAGQTTNMQNITDNLTAVQNAATNATNAAASATAAASSATAAATSETNAATSETNAATSATNASNSASAASTSASAASTSATAAASSATAAAASETNAGTSETNAASSASAAATSATNAGTSETNAASSATAAAASATSASAAQTAAESARDSALASFDSFDDRYLGTKTSDPTVDNDGDALVAGALYFNSTDGEMKVYNGTSWVDAYADGASLVSKSGDTMTGNLSFGDSNKAIFGAGSDLEIYHNGTDSFIDEKASGWLYIRANDMVLGKYTGETYVKGIADGAVELYYDNAKKIETTSTGASVTGGLTVNLGTDAFGKFANNISEVGSGNLAFQVANTAESALKPFGIRAEDIRFATGSSERMRIDSSGNVGIGTNSPSRELEVTGSGNVYLKVTAPTANDSAGIELANTGGTWLIQNDDTSNEALTFDRAGTEVMRIDSSGNVGIGNTAPSEILDIKSVSSAPTMRIHADTTSSPAPAIELQRGTNDTWGADNYTDFRIENSEGHLKFFGGTSGTTSEYMRLENDKDLHVDGNVVAYSTTISDIRLKKDIAPIEDAVTKVQQLNGCTFTYLKDDRKSAGLIAQDVEKVLPSAVIEDEAVFHGEKGETYKTVQYDQLVGLLVEAVKELKAEIEELKDASSK